MIKTTPRNKNAPIFEATSDGRNSIVGLPFDFQDLCSRAMDQALGVEEASLSAVVDLNSCLLDIYRNSFWLAPAMGNILEAAAKTLTFYTELQMSWFALLLPHAKVGSGEALAHFAEPGITIASGHGESEHDVENSIGQGKAA